MAVCLVQELENEVRAAFAATALSGAAARAFQATDVAGSNHPYYSTIAVALNNEDSAETALELNGEAGMVGNVRKESNSAGVDPAVWADDMQAPPSTGQEVRCSHPMLCQEYREGLCHVERDAVWWMRGPSEPGSPAARTASLVFELQLAWFECRSTAPSNMLVPVTQSDIPSPSPFFGRKFSKAVHLRMHVA